MLLNKITIFKGTEHIGEALRYIPKHLRERNGREVIFYDRNAMERFYARLRELRGDKPDNTKMRLFNFGSYR